MKTSCLRCSEVGEYKRAVCHPCIEKIMLDAKERQKQDMQRMAEKFMEDHVVVIKVKS